MDSVYSVGKLIFNQEESVMELDALGKVKVECTKYRDIVEVK